MNIKHTKNGKNGTEPTIRVDKFLASRGISARRNITEILQKQVITIHGKRVKEPGIRFNPETDELLIDGKEVPAPLYEYIKLYKPKDIISTASDEFGRKTVVSLVQSSQRLYPVGRLDQDTTGLLLLTNDGELANRLTHPRYHISKMYELTISGKVSEEKLAKFRRGIRLEDGMTAKAAAKIIREEQNNTIVEVILHEGKKRQIRRMCEFIRLPLLELKRVKMGPITLGNMKVGEYKKLTDEEIEMLQKEAYRS
ncbi:MAG: rRNA pseudouridine synthase [Candidatus Levybacteria bacterium]|nr:rRNA pseudouridine synthase [Candidatus Levybacteria bacterium]